MDKEPINFRKVFIGNISYDITKLELEEFFNLVGPIIDIK